MKLLDAGLFADVADAIRLPSPAFVEKDYYAVQLLKIISEINRFDGSLIFAGGTCLAKAHLQTYRMSEDLDLKFVPANNFFNLSDNQKRQFRSDLGSIVIEEIEHDGLFKLTNKESRSEGRYRCLSISYPKSHDHFALRPELKLEITEAAKQHVYPTNSAISSIYATVLQQQPEIQSIACDHIETILVEKFVGLLRRTAEATRGRIDSDDTTLVRHVYDLYLINAHIHDSKHLRDKFEQIIQRDIVQFGMRHTEFKYAPVAELMCGLDALIDDNKYKTRYKQFLGPLVYNASPPSWERCIKSLKILAGDLMLSTII